MPATRPTVEQLLALVDSFDWAAYNLELADGMTRIARNLVEGAGGELHGVDFDFDDPFVSAHTTKYVADRVTQLAETTKADLKRVLRQAFDAGEGLGTAQLQDLVLSRVRETFEGYEAWRALRIARTESATLYNVANILGERQGGAEFVRVVDGHDCPQCAAADGAKWTIEEALANPLEHPSCRRGFLPYFDDETDELR
jgi:hypothetical protein